MSLRITDFSNTENGVLLDYIRYADVWYFWSVKKNTEEEQYIPNRTENRDPKTVIQLNHGFCGLFHPYPINHLSQTERNICINSSSCQHKVTV